MPSHKFESNLPKRIPRLIIFLCLTFSIVNQFHYQSNIKNVKSSKLVGKQNDDYNQSISKLSWAYSGLSINKIQKIVNGNRRSVGYKLAVWNCGRGLVQQGYSIKLNEIKQFIEAKKPHCFAVIESDFYGHNSEINRVNKYTTNEIREMLKIDGYKIEFPKT